MNAAAEERPSLLIENCSLLSLNMDAEEETAKDSLNSPIFERLDVENIKVNGISPIKSMNNVHRYPDISETQDNVKITRNVIDATHVNPVAEKRILFRANSKPTDKIFEKWGSEN
ncbi:hypothetical protein AVEN_250886-1 [Araneus ventricosus]|uniref:Uncharacterized protein n=1 Tax=Araneus ventricosus TaxID=182803 RepID=A0A4Y2NMW3_ARAVE|nr:hypothetical protein AVEN_250886-1 [Araneus ventricosus]